MNFEIGLIKPKNASRTLASFVGKVLEILEDTMVRSSSECRHSDISTCKVNDVVLVEEEGRLSAGQVWAFVETMDEQLAILQRFTLLSRDRSNSIATFRVHDDYDFCPISDILDPACWNQFNANSIRVLLPIDIDAFI